MYMMLSKLFTHLACIMWHLPKSFMLEFSLIVLTSAPRDESVNPTSVSMIVRCRKSSAVQDFICNYTNV